MFSAVATPALSESGSHSQPASQHTYGTRIRSNSVIRPSVRLRQSPDPPPRRIKPVPSAKVKALAASKEPASVDMPTFPPPNVTLHADDADSKVFLAIGRSFVSVDNKAMTIKDLADMTMKFGLMCQNVSAAGQAITTYIRNHLQRCEIQQDHPLLLRHVLSGTPSDDDLASALHSRSGGAHCTLSPGDTRVTNFRRGTVVWYLSRAAGVPCPFSRAGVRLCDYNENGRVGTVVNPGKERKRERDRLRRAEQSGQKRKRLPRACATRQDSDSESSEEEDRPPPKVKLTLRLKPSLAYHSSTSPPAARASSPREIVDLSRESDSEDESMSEDSSDEHERTQEAPCSLPAYPRQSIDIPCHTPSIDETFSSYSPSFSTSPRASNRPWRSPSVPFSIASPPPDSEEEDEDEDEDDSDTDTDIEDEEGADIDLDMEVANSSLPDTTSGYDSPSFDEDEDEDDFDDYDTQWGESPGPMSPPAQFEDDEVQVKQDPQDVGGFLDAWESLESDATDLKVLNVITQAAAGAPPSEEIIRFKREEEDFDLSRWNTDDLINPFDRDLLVIKQEEEDAVIPPLEYKPTSPLPSPVTLYSTLPTPFTPDDDGSPVVESYISHRRYTEPLWRDAVLLGPDSVQLKDLDDGLWQFGTTRKSCPNVLSTGDHYTPQSTGSHDTGSKSPTEAASSHDASITASQVPRSSPIQGCSADEQPHSAGSVALSIAEEDLSTSAIQGPVVVRTCEPCEPAISATELEGISVYQMSLGSSSIYRRIDTDFVKITPVVKFFDMTPPDASTLQGSVVVSRGSPAVRGTWLALASAQGLLQDRDVLRVFLSDDLHKRFPQALQDFHSSNSRERSFVQFGPNFLSTAEAKRKLLGSFRVEMPTRDGYGAEDGESQAPWDHWLLSPTFASHQGTTPFTEPAMEPETPLSPTEEEMFHTLCTVSDWESTPAACPAVPINSACTSSAVPEVPPVEPPFAATLPSVSPCSPPVEAPLVEVVSCREKPLRRSRRTVVRAASRPRTRSAVKISKAVHS